MATDAEEIPPDWRPLPLPTAILAFAGTLAFVAWTADRAHGFDEHFPVVCVATCGAQTVLVACRWATRRRPAALLVAPGPAAVRWSLFAVLVAAPLAYALLGLPPEDGLLTAVPAVWLGGEVLLAAGVRHMGSGEPAALPR